MKYLHIIVVLLFFLIPGCLESSAYKDVSGPQLLSNPGEFEGKKICTDLVYQNDGFPNVSVVRNQNFTLDIKNWTLTEICGTYRSGTIGTIGTIEPDSVNPILAIATEKDVYYSNETLNVSVDYYSKIDGKAHLDVSGIKNDFGRPSISNVSNITVEKGINSFNLDFTTPSCEECSALSPGEYTVNASLTVGEDTFESYKRITLARNESNSSQNETNISELNNTPSVSTENIFMSNNVTLVEYFYIIGCKKCEQATPVVEAMMKSYGPRVKFIKINAKEEGRELAIEYGIPGTPSIVINKDVKNLISYDSYNGNTSKLEEILSATIDNATVLQNTPEVVNGNKIILSVPSVFVVGFLAGFNPCLLAILAFIASVTLATTGKRRNVLLIVIMFSLGIFVTYLIVGIGLLSIFEQSSGLQSSIKNFLIALIGLLGIWHIYDAYHLRRNEESSFYTPKVFIRLTEAVTKKVSLPAAFFVGALFSLIKAPCVGAVYFVILDMVRSGKGEGLLYLASYNFGVILPVLIIGCAIAFGLNPEKVEKFRKEQRSSMRFFTGLTLVVVAALMYFGII